MSLEDLRQEIDGIDRDIVDMIARRVRLAREIGREKKAERRLVEDKGRENRVIESVKDLARSRDITERDIAAIYRQIIAACRRVQGVNAAYQGEPGAYTEEAAAAFFGPSVDLKPCETLEEVLKGVESEEYQFGVLPIENSLEGSISRVYDLLLDSRLMVCGETELRISHCLIANERATIESIRKVYSHPQALGQSRNFLKHLNAESVPAYNTAAAVKMVKEQGSPDVAAIGSAAAAEMYGLRVLAREIEDNPNNYTRFFILAREDSPPSGADKTSIVFSTRHQPGSLVQSLGEFASRRINLTKLESRPTRHKPWEYNFYLDFEGHRQDPTPREALAALEKGCIFLKILGSYPRARNGN